MSTSDDSDDGQLKYAIALSLQDECDPQSKITTNQDDTNSDKASQSVSILSSLDRKTMEQQRLARLASKRSRAESVSQHLSEMPLPKKRFFSPAGQSSSKELPYPRGVVKRTWVKGYERTGEDIKIEEILQREDLSLAFFSSFQWDEPWLLSKVDMSRTKIILAAFAGNEAQQQDMQRNAPKNIRFCFPKMNGFGSMHSKLQILKFANHLRIVIPTGNLVPHDWGESGVMENMVFLIDLPLNADQQERNAKSSFLAALTRYLRAMGVDNNLTSSLTKYDFSQADKLGFVYSIPGSHSEAAFLEVGFNGLGTCVKALGLDTREQVQIDIACASLGAIKVDFIQAMYLACQGTIGGGNEAKEASKALEQVDIQEQFRIYFPSHDTVAESRGGEAAAGTICLQQKWWLAPTFPKLLIRDCVNNRKGLLMHSKIILVRPGNTLSSSAAQGQPWAYIGSANLSESAWGRRVKDKPSSTPKISCRNWECGVVIPCHAHNKTGHSNSANPFEGIVPIPMQMPGRKYSREEQPWFYHLR